MEDQLILHAYRHLYRKGLRAVRNAVPSRHTLRHILRSSFRSGNRSDFDPDKIARTLEFLDRAAESNSYEHKIIKNLMHVRFFEHRWTKNLGTITRDLDSTQKYLRRSAHAHFNSTLMLLNESLGTCLR